MQLRQHLGTERSVQSVENCRKSLCLQEYNTAVQTEDFKVAARLRDEAAISLRGWWHMQSSSAENPGHLLRIRQAFDRYVLLAYSPQDIANIHVRLFPQAVVLKLFDLKTLLCRSLPSVHKIAV